MRYVDKQVLIGEPMKKAYEDNKIKLRNFIIESSFIPPQTQDEKKIFDHYPDELKRFIKKKKILFVMNASKFDLWGGEDIYGFDLCLKLMNDINNNDIICFSDLWGFFWIF